MGTQLCFPVDTTAGIFFVGYLVKFGVAWHDAGAPFNLTDIQFSAYWSALQRPLAHSAQVQQAQAVSAGCE